jgi:hypothetical protein
MNPQNTIENIFLKKKDKNLPDPGANSQVYILNLSHCFCCWAILSKGCYNVAVRVRAVRLHYTPFTHNGAHALQHCNIGTLWGYYFFKLPIISHLQKVHLSAK